MNRKTNLKKEHKKICHLCKKQVNQKDEDMWTSFEECVEYSKAHNSQYRELYQEKYGVDYREVKHYGKGE